MRRLLPPGAVSAASGAIAPAALRGRYVYGVYAETPDHLPLLGRTHAGSSIVYAVGCNAWGQASLSYVASLLPGLLGCGRACQYAFAYVVIRIPECAAGVQT